MKLPRDLSGADLTRRLAKLGYLETRRSGSHVRLTRKAEGREHHLTVPDHDSIKIGTLNGILKDVSEHLQIEKDDLATRLFG